ncbi:alpha/beta hydrolase [Blastococcus sp. SYSU D00820]
MPLHPEIAERLHLLDGIANWFDAQSDPGKLARLQEYGRWPEQPRTDVEVSDDRAPGPHGEVPVRVYRPEGGPAGPRPALVWMHGGAFLGGDLDMREADGVAREVAVRAGAVVVSVDYRLAQGEICYPVPHDDVVAAIRWVRHGAADLGIDPERITVGGASAGGNLATGATLRLRDDDGWLPAALLLAYSTVHAVVPEPGAPLAALLAELPPMLRFFPDDRLFITRNYVGGPESRADGYAMPANAAVDGLCPVVLLNAEYDDLRPSSEAFAGQLAVAGVDVRQVVVRTMAHGFLDLPARLEPVGAGLDLMAGVVAAPGA